MRYPPPVRIPRALQLSLPFLALLTACGDDQGSNGSGSGGPPPEPQSGVWQYNDAGFVERGCGDQDVYRDEDGVLFELTYDGSDAFTIGQGSAGDFSCTLDGDEFVCPQRLTLEEPVPDTDAVLSYSVSIEGRFTSDTTMEGEQLAEIGCTGSSCALAPSVLGTELPCNYIWAFTAEAN